MGSDQGGGGGDEGVAADVMESDGALMGRCEVRGEEGGYQSLAGRRSGVCRLHEPTLWGVLGDLGEVVARR